MNNQEKFTTRSNKLKVHRANLRTISSYPVRFANDIIVSRQIFHRYSLFLFSFLCLSTSCLFLFLFFSFLFFFCFFFVLFFVYEWKIYILIHIRQYRRVDDKKIFTRPISGNKTTLFLDWVASCELMIRLWVGCPTSALYQVCIIILHYFKFARKT